MYAVATSRRRETAKKCQGHFIHSQQETKAVWPSDRDSCGQYTDKSMPNMWVNSTPSIMTRAHHALRGVWVLGEWVPDVECSKGGRQRREKKGDLRLA